MSWILAVKILAAALTPVVTWFVGKLVLTLDKKWKVEITGKQRERLTGLVEDGLRYAENEAITYLKATEKKQPSVIKKQNALDYVKGVAKEEGMIIDEDIMSKMIESYFFKNKPNLHPTKIEAMTGKLIEAQSPISSLEKFGEVSKSLTDLNTIMNKMASGGFKNDSKIKSKKKGKK